MMNPVISSSLMRRSCWRSPHYRAALLLVQRASSSCGAVVTTAIRRNNMSTSATRKPIALFLNASRLDYDRQLGTFVFFFQTIRPRRNKKTSQPHLFLPLLQRAYNTCLKTDNVEILLLLLLLEKKQPKTLIFYFINHCIFTLLLLYCY